MGRREKVRNKSRERLRRSRKFALIAALCLIAAVGCSCAGGGEANDAENNAAVENAEAEPKIIFELPSFQFNIDDSINAVSQAKAEETAALEEEAQEEEAPPPDDLSGLKQQIDDALASYSGNWSVYVKNLDTGYCVSINDRTMYAASEIKLFALAAAYQQISEGILNEGDIYGSLYGMITESSNEDFNRIVWNVGKYYITDWCSENGYEDTVQCHGLYPAYNADGLQTWSGYNYTSAEDTGKLLESIYNGECVSQECSEKMLEILSDQHLVNKIPAGVPEDVKVANKTGETLDFCHDAAIVFSDNADYILTVMVDAPGYAWSCSDRVVELSELVYDYFNNEDTEINNEYTEDRF